MLLTVLVIHFYVTSKHNLSLLLSFCGARSLDKAKLAVLALEVSFSFVSLWWLDYLTGLEDPFMSHDCWLYPLSSFGSWPSFLVMWQLTCYKTNDLRENSDHEGNQMPFQLLTLWSSTLTFIVFCSLEANHHKSRSQSGKWKWDFIFWKEDCHRICRYVIKISTNIKQVRLTCLF